jgi:small GTP-binding protein
MTSNDSETDNSKYDFSFKMIVIGDAGVGKSCLTSRAIKERFETDYSPTVGFEFLTFSTKIEDKVIKLQIWDTCGQEVYRSLITNFYRNASLAMMVYSIDSRESFLHINQWLKEIKLQSHPDVKIILIGNKSDLKDERQVTYQEAKRFKDENQLLYFEETSAKTGINAKEVFTEAARILFNEHKKYKMRANTREFDNKKQEITPTKLTKVEQNRNKGCC